MRVINQFVLAPGLARRGVGYPHRYDESWHSEWRELTGHLGIVTIVHSCDRALVNDGHRAHCYSLLTVKSWCSGNDVMAVLSDA